ncbi:MAG: hypothetical protein ACREJN_12120, partial [Nitrospiraceae bacterium]
MASRAGCQAGTRRHHHAGFGVSQTNGNEQLAQDCSMGGAYHTTHRKGGLYGHALWAGDIFWIKYYSA